MGTLHPVIEQFRQSGNKHDDFKRMKSPVIKQNRHCTATGSKKLFDKGIKCTFSWSLIFVFLLTFYEKWK